MAAQKHKKKFVGRNFFAFSNAYKHKSQLINPIHDEIQKQETLGNYFCLKICSTVNFPKKTSRFSWRGNRPKTQSSDLHFFITCPFTYELNIKIVLGI